MVFFRIIVLALLCFLKPESSNFYFLVNVKCLANKTSITTTFSPIVSDRKNWTEEEREAIGPLVNKSLRTGKPPAKAEVLHFKQKNCLKNLDWKKIKYQVWAITQQYKRKQTKLFL